MTEPTTNLPVTEADATEAKGAERSKIAEEQGELERPAAERERWPFENLRRDIERAFEEFYRGPWRLFTRTAFDTEPVWPREVIWGKSPALDIVETDQGYTISTELPGVSASDVEVKLSSGELIIKCAKKETKEEERRRVHVSERRYGTLQRTLRVPENVEAGKIEANFSNGVLTIKLPKKAEAQGMERSIEVKAA